MKVHVRVITKLFGHSPDSIASVGTPTISPLHASCAVKSSAEGTSAAHCTVMSSGATGAAGASVSTIVIVHVTDVAFPHASVAVYVKVCSSTFGHSPMDTLPTAVSVTSLQLSAHSGVYVGNSSPHSIVTSVGGFSSVGASVSFTVMVWLTVLALPHPSVKVHVRITVNRFGQPPSIVSSFKTPSTVPQLSEAVNVSGDSTSSAHWTVISSKTGSISGALVSTTVIIWVHLLTPSHSSVAIHSLFITVTHPSTVVVSFNSTVTFKPQP